MTETRETQESVGRWINETFPGTDPESPRKAIRALEECIELCRASGATWGQIWDAIDRVDMATGDKSEENISAEPAKIPAEAADVLIVLYGVAHMRGFDLHAEVDRKMAVNRSRRWAARGDGTGYHIPDAEPPTTGGVQA